MVVVLLVVLVVLLILVALVILVILLVQLIRVHLILVILLILVLGHDRGSPHTLILSSSSAQQPPWGKPGTKQPPWGKGGKATGPPTKILVLALQPRTHCTVLLRKSVIDT